MSGPPEPRELEARLQAAQEEIARLRGAFGTFAQRVSHDLQGVFGNIDGFAGALQDVAGPLGERQARYVERIRAGARHGEGVLRDLAALAAVTAVEVQPQAVDAHALAGQAIAACAPACAGRAVHWEVSAAPWPRPWADAALLRLALDELLANALKFTRGRAAAHIRLRATAAAQDWTLEVQDNGVGFEADQAGRLFGAFERLHDAGAYEGRGMGLALVRAWTERQGGTVAASAGAGEGAVFRLLLPLAPDAAPVAAPAAPVGRPLRILLVDDDAMVRATVRMMLEREGHVVLDALDGPQALQRLAAPGGAAVDLLLTDWVMPEVGGEAVIHAARAAVGHLKVIVVTGQRPGGAEGSGLPVAVDAVLEKPVRLAALRETLARLG